MINIWKKAVILDTKKWSNNFQFLKEWEKESIFFSFLRFADFEIYQKIETFNWLEYFSDIPKKELIKFNYKFYSFACDWAWREYFYSKKHILFIILNHYENI